VAIHSAEIRKRTGRSSGRTLKSQITAIVVAIINRADSNSWAVWEMGMRAWGDLVIALITDTFVARCYE
jgi:hypothetical protein